MCFFSDKATGFEAPERDEYVIQFSFWIRTLLCLRVIVFTLFSIPTKKQQL